MEEKEVDVVADLTVKKEIYKDSRPMLKTMNEQERNFYEDRKETLEHYNGKWDLSRQYTVVTKQRNMLEMIGVLSMSINPDRKTRIIFDYDPDFKEGLIQVM